MLRVTYFYRCGHCKHLTPEYKKLGEAVQKDSSLKNRVVIGKVEQTAYWSTLLGLQNSNKPKGSLLENGGLCATARHGKARQSRLMARVCLQVDADAHRSLGEKFGVQGFPTIKFFGRGKPVSSPEE